MKEWNKYFKHCQRLTAGFYGIAWGTFWDEEEEDDDFCIQGYDDDDGENDDNDGKAEMTFDSTALNDDNGGGYGDDWDRENEK